MKKIITLAVLLICTALPYADTESSLTLTPCQLPGTGAKAECGTLEVLENPADPESNRIPIKVVVLPALTKTPQPDPLFMFAGGPGQSAIESFPPIISRLRKLRFDREIVLIDQRGTGQSNPLDCPTSEEAVLTQLDWTRADIEKYARDCLQQLSGDPRYYTTSIAVEDFNAVRQALGYQKINLLGISYGTRAAQVYMKRFPETVRSVVLDGVVPTDLILGTEHAIKLDQTLNKIIQRCQQDDTCHSRFPALKQNIETLKNLVQTEPVTLKIPSPRTGNLTDIHVNKDVLAMSIRMLSYSPETQALLPLLIHEAAEGSDLSRLAAQALMVQESLQESISRGMELSVLCAEDVPHFPVTPSDEKTLLGNTMIETSKTLCKIWPAGTAPDDFHTPFSSDIPVLLLSGEFDPVTPPEYGERALQQYANGRHLIASGQGHSVTIRGCMPKIITQFINQGTADDLNTECLKNMGPSPFFTTLLGPQP